ncbi:MAG: hypothetical protein M1819_007390 [Sarea resinae]|nr:MAG: hypothetical protein M1819_007390 [Sarea resinae]
MGALEKEVRLSFAQRIRGTLPEPYQPLVSESKEKDAPDFKYDSDQTPYAQEGRELLALLRKKSSEDEIQSVINTIHAKAATLGVADTLVPSTDAYVTAICHLGSKSLSHVLSCIERCKDRLLAIGAQSPTAARRQIISSVMEYWHDQPGVGVNIVDKLLNYTILTPLSVVEWVLIDHLGGGKILAQSHIYEMVATTVHKVTKRLRDILAARRRPGLSDAEVKVLDETVDRERPELGNLFRVIEDALVGVAAGVTDEELEAGAMDADEGKLEAEFLKAWGQSWLRVFRRVFAVEEAAAQVVEEQAQRLATQGKKDGIEGMAVADGNENGLENGDVEGGPVGMGIE